MNNLATSENWQTIPDFLRELTTLVCALFDNNGQLVDANRGFFKLTQTDSLSFEPWHAASLLSSPTVAQLLVAEADGSVVYRGILNFGPKEGTAYSLHGTVYRYDKRLFLVAEPDIAELARLNENVIRLNEEMAEMGRELQRKNNKLQQEETVINAQLEQLRKTNNDLKQAQNQLLHTEKLASIGQLAAGVAHEINNPIGFIFSNLNSLDGYIQDLFNTLELYEKSEYHLTDTELAALHAQKLSLDLSFLKTDVPHLLGETREGINRVKIIVQHLKDFADLDSGEGWQWSSLRRLLDSTLDIIGNALKQKAEVIVEYGEMPEIQCLPSHLNQVFMSLLLNAAQSMVNRGSIIVRSGADTAEVWVEIADNGRGITPEHLSRIFDPFFTTLPVGQGYGLGLSLSYGIVKKHHGHITVQSIVGKGTTFRITLPISQTQLNKPPEG